jgi:L-ascorbate metabolism protein UlaG (beta-lactamase superfamily)
MEVMGMDTKTWLFGLALAMATIVSAAPAWSQNVKITPLGSHDGEFCRNDRALVLEDPDGTRILYDAGRTVRGPDDPRLGKIDGVLVTHVHIDHLGSEAPTKANEGTCAAPKPSMKVTPNSNVLNIVVGKKAKLFVTSEMAKWLSKKVVAAGGSADQVLLVRFGAMRKLGGVSIYSVPASHSNGIDPEFLEGNLAKELAENGLTAYVGQEGGYVLKFSNGLVAYLSGDTGIIAEQDVLIRRYFKANLAVINIDGTFVTGPQEAAFVINDLVKPRAAIPLHANEEATKDGKLNPKSLTAEFIKHTKVSVHVPLSGKTMEFDKAAKCVAGCGK